MTTQKNVAVNYINQGLPNMAVRDLRPLERQNPKDADLKNLLGLSYLAMKNSKVAVGYFEQAYRISPKASVALNLSSAYIDVNQNARAIKILKDLKSSDEGKAYQYPERIAHNIALAADKMQKPNVAERYYKQALQDNPYFYISLMRLGQLYERYKKDDLAFRQFLKAREACLTCFDPVQALVRSQVSKGQVKLAMKTLREYLANKEVQSEDRMKAKQLMVSTSQQRGQPQAKGTLKPKPIRTN